MVGVMNNENKFVLVGNIVAFKEEFLEEEVKEKEQAGE